MPRGILIPSDIAMSTGMNNHELVGVVVVVVVVVVEESEYVDSR